MRTSLVIALALLGFGATSASAAGGLALRWDQCYGDGGTINRNFACSTNSGTNALVASFQLGQYMLYPSGAEMVFGVAAATTQLPAWWMFKNAGACRQASLGAILFEPAAINCPDWMNGQGAGGISTYEVGAWGPNSARIVAVSAIPVAPTIDLFEEQEYFTLRLRFDNAKTVGAGACAGCDVPMCIVFQSIRLSLAWVPLDDVVVTGPLNGTDSHYATWQGGGSPVSSLGTGCPAATPTRRGTWGAVKALYR